MKKTPLYEIHVKSGGKIIDFGGWALPVQYAGIIEEHRRVRSAAGLFDVSHMGEITVCGRDAGRFIQRVVTNDVLKAQQHQIVYSPMCYPHGGIVDDLLIYKYDDENYLLVVNAANAAKDFDWLKDMLYDFRGKASAQSRCGSCDDSREAGWDVAIKDVSDTYSLLALQGPEALRILQKLTDFPLQDMKFYRFNPGVQIDGVKTMISRTGYTGEDGFEIYLNPKDAPQLWMKIIEAGKDEGIVPAGLGARDTLRFEAALPLYGQEISEDISPVEAGLTKFVKLDKDDFIGKEALKKQDEEGAKRKLVGFEMVDRGIPRTHYDVTYGDEKIGFVTTGSYSPSLEKNIGLALVDSRHSKPGAEFCIVIRNRQLKARVVNLPFYSRKLKKTL